MRLGLLFALPLIGFAQLCKPGQIAITSEKTWGAGLGHNYQTAVIRNTSKSACYVEGVPRVVLLDEAGNVVPSKTSGNTAVNACGEGSNRYLLKPGESARIWTVTLFSNFVEKRLWYAPCALA